MAKELPYFKFEPQTWDTGNIQMCSLSSKGLFADLCSLYWSRLGELPYALALQKLCKGDKLVLQELLDNQIIGVIDDQIVIEFLDEQLEERGQISEKRRESAKKRWSDASALQTESKGNAKRREERRREEKRREESDAGEPATLETRSLIFYKKLEPFLDTYSKDMLRAFYSYWTEKNDGGRRMRFEMQKVFDIKKRLVTWSNNEKQKSFGKQDQKNNLRTLAEDFAKRASNMSSGKEF